jgi:hypothetical protein
MLSKARAAISFTGIRPALGPASHMSLDFTLHVKPSKHVF